jgi:hypothetical protein
MLRAMPIEPAPPETAWVARAALDHWHARRWAGFDAQHCRIDRNQQHATCPAGNTDTGWTPAVDSRGDAGIKLKASIKGCRRCDQRAQCTRSQKRYPRRTLTIRPQPSHQARHVPREREATKAFQAGYARRAGIEGTISRGVRATRLRRIRYTGLTRVRLSHILAAAGLNVLRLGEWFLKTEHATTRITPLARLIVDASVV